MPAKPPEFDAYSRDYANLIRDPIRERFAADGRFFAERKLQVIRGFYRRRKVDTHRLHWLDVGCGSGELLRIGRSFFARSAGCDPSGGMLEACGDLEVRPQPAVDRIPFDAGAFDLATAVCVLHHVPEDGLPILIREMLRVLRPGGVLAVIEHNPLNPVTRLIVSRTPVDADAKLLTASSARRLVSSAGARILETRYFLFLPQRIHAWLGSIESALARVPLGGQYAVFGNAEPLRGDVGGEPRGSGEPDSIGATTRAARPNEEAKFLPSGTRDRLIGPLSPCYYPKLRKNSCLARPVARRRVEENSTDAAPEVRNGDPAAEPLRASGSGVSWWVAHTKPA